MRRKMEGEASLGNTNSAGAINSALLAGEDDLKCQTLVHTHVLATIDRIVLNSAVKLRLFDAIHDHGDHPISLTKLAGIVPAFRSNPHTLRRFMRYLANMRLVNLHKNGGHKAKEEEEEEEEERYTLTHASSIYLRESSARSMAAYVRLTAELYVSEHAVNSWLPGDVSVTEKLKKRSFFAGDSEANERFNDGMTCGVRPAVEALIGGCREIFEGVGTLVDVGGGSGLAAGIIARAFPSIRCVVYELPRVMDEEKLKGEGVECVVGDMFVSVPAADAVMLMRVLHDWDDERAIQILKRCREAIDKVAGKLIVVDMVITDNDDGTLKRMKLAQDMAMMVFSGGQERTEDEWRSLFLKAGFTRCNVFRIMAVYSVIEARP